MLAHPILINRPIVVTPKGTKLCRPSEAVLDLLDHPVGPFVKEDGEVIASAQSPSGPEPAEVAPGTAARSKFMPRLPPASRRGIISHGTCAPIASDELAGQPGPRPACPRATWCAVSASAAGPAVSICRAASSSSTRCIRSSRAADFAGTISRPTKATVFEYGPTGEGDAGENWRRSAFFTCSNTAMTRCGSILPIAPRSISR